MKRLLIVGSSPLPDENTKSRPAAALRTWQFVQPFLREGGTVIADKGNAFGSVKRPHFQVRLVTIAMPECYDKEPEYREICESEDFAQYRFSKNDPDLMNGLSEIHDEFQPDAIIGVNTYPAYIAAQIKSEAPFWADLNGWVMAEAQAQAFKAGSNAYIPHYLAMEREILMRSDKISAVSMTESYAILGELAQLGRLNGESFGYNFCEHIPNGTQWFDGEQDFKEKPEIFKNVPHGAFALLWMGGYNTWVDEVTLFEGVIAAMEKCEKLHFVSTGGSIAGLDNKTFARFKEMIEGSAFKERFVFLGWVETADIPYIYSRSDCGINVDRKCVETATGARNRLNEMMKFGLPVVTTLGSEISYEVRRAGAGIGARSGNAENLGEALCKMYDEWRGGGELRTQKFRDFGKAGQNYIENECNYLGVLTPLISWLDSPLVAPDKGVRLPRFGRLSSSLKYLADRGIWHSLKKLWTKMRR